MEDELERLTVTVSKEQRAFLDKHGYRPSHMFRQKIDEEMSVRAAAEKIIKDKQRKAK